MKISEQEQAERREELGRREEGEVEPGVVSSQMMVVMVVAMVMMVMNLSMRNEPV